MSEKPLIRAPQLTEKLLAWLDQKFPDRCPLESDSERQVWIKKGQRTVVEHLRTVFEEQRRHEVRNDEEDY